MCMVDENHVGLSDFLWTAVGGYIGRTLQPGIVEYPVIRRVSAMRRRLGPTQAGVSQLT